MKIKDIFASNFIVWAEGKDIRNIYFIDANHLDMNHLTISEIEKANYIIETQWSGSIDDFLKTIQTNAMDRVLRGVVSVEFKDGSYNVLFFGVTEEYLDQSKIDINSFTIQIDASIEKPIISEKDIEHLKSIETEIGWFWFSSAFSKTKIEFYPN